MDKNADIHNISYVFTMKNISGMGQTDRLPGLTEKRTNGCSA